MSNDNAYFLPSDPRDFPASTREIEPGNYEVVAANLPRGVLPTRKGLTTRQNHAAEHAALSATVTASRTLTLDDADEVIICNHATVAIVLTIPTDAVAGWTGAVSIALAQVGAASATFAAGGSVTLRSSHPAASQYTAKGILRIGSNEWMCV